MRSIFQKLRNAGLKLKPSKCEFFKDRIPYLGHIVSKDGVEMDPKKIQVILDWPRTQTVYHVRSFLGFTSYYRKCMYRYSHIVRPLNDLISRENAKKNLAPIKWGPEQQNAFDKLKGLCSQAPILVYADYKKPF